jgi:4-hydroxy-tetrahydrodipicolinate reductase
MMRIGLLGYGKMGKAIHRRADELGFDVVWHSPSQSTYPLVFEFPKDVPDLDVVIEFSTPSAATGHIRACLERGIPVVVGTTGWYADYDQLSDLCTSQGGAMLCATNFSVGVHLFWEFAERMTQWMKPWTNYQIGIEEIHHTEKKDAPSGTALTLRQRVLAQLASTAPNNVFSADIPIISHRTDGVVGTHQLIFRSDRDEISLQHQAFDRDAFAEGALRAARWIIGKSGVFDFGDVLKEQIGSTAQIGASQIGA